jgi:hypothetical protein
VTGTVLSGPGFEVNSRLKAIGEVMQSHTPVSKFSVLFGGLLSALVLSTSAFAQHSGGGGHASGGGAHFSGGGAHAVAGGYHGGYAGYGGYHGGYGYGGWHGGYGYGGWHGGYGWGGYGWRGGWGCCGWGWGWGGLGLGLYFASLPLYYNTYYWGGVPYYYADNTYYIYDPNAKQYETVAPPQEVQDQAAAANGGTAGGAPADIIAYPKNGQSADQQSKDKFECHQWAANQTGFDPTQGAAAPGNKRNDYMRAQAACLEGRGYSVN